MSRLPPLLTSADLPEAELRAAALDGEVFAFHGGYCPIDEIEGAIHRARVLAAAVPPRAIVERRSAAWVFGLFDERPVPVEVCTGPGLRTKAGPRPGLVIREVVIDSHEIVSIGGLRLTTPLRTALDLARFERSFGEEESRLLLALSRLGRFDLDDAVAAIGSRRNLPNKHLALARLAASLPGP